jgi:hypothetical protein
VCDRYMLTLTGIMVVIPYKAKGKNAYFQNLPVLYRTFPG